MRSLLIATLAVALSGCANYFADERLVAVKEACPAHSGASCQSLLACRAEAFLHSDHTFEPADPEEASGAFLATLHALGIQTESLHDPALCEALFDRAVEEARALEQAENDATTTNVLLGVGAAVLITAVAIAAAQGGGGGSSCCKVCTTGKPCGDTCIAKEMTCHVGVGCAC